MADNQQWLTAGLRTLEEFGAPGLTIERLMGRVGLSKGSFYHHFGGMGGFRTTLLAHYEASFTTLYIDVVEQDSQATPRAKIERLLDMVCAEDDDWYLEVALRAWALQDPEVAQAQERVDRIRLEYLRGLWHGVSGDAEQAAIVGRLLYTLLIGAGQLRPPVLAGELRKVYDFVLGLLRAAEQPVPSGTDATHVSTRRPRRSSATR